MEMNELENIKQKSNNNKNNMILFIICICLSVALVIVLFYKRNNNLTPSPNENNQKINSPTEYNNEKNNNESNSTNNNVTNNSYSDADLICEINTTDDNGRAKVKGYSYIYFNKDGYRTKIYSVATHVYNNLLDNEYNEIISKLCNYSNCSNNNYEITEPEFGFKVNRDGNTFVVSEYAFRGKGIEATKEKMDDIKEEFIYKGYSCK